MPSAAVVSFRLGGTDGVSVEAAKWVGALSALGFEVTTVAGEGVADQVLAGLARQATLPPAPDDLRAALDGADVVVVENLLSLPLNRPAWEAVASVLAGRPAVLHHHDLAWQRSASAGGPAPPDDPAWAHVTINQASRGELAARGIEAACLYNRFPLTGWDGDRAGTRARLGLGAGTSVAVHPVRAIARKDVATAVRLAERLGATYWLTGPAEDGYGPELDRILAGAACPVLRATTADAADAYAAADLVAYPSLLEGFGNPVVESALARRPLAIRRYPVALELAAFGFRWFDVDDPGDIDRLAHFGAGAGAADAGAGDLLDANEAIARAGFGLDRLPAELAGVLERVL